MTSYNF